MTRDKSALAREDTGSHQSMETGRRSRTAHCELASGTDGSPFGPRRVAGSIVISSALSRCDIR